MDSNTEITRMRNFYHKAENSEDASKTGRQKQFRDLAIGQDFNLFEEIYKFEILIMRRQLCITFMIDDSQPDVRCITFIHQPLSYLFSELKQKTSFYSCLTPNMINFRFLSMSLCHIYSGLLLLQCLIYRNTAYNNTNSKS